VKSPLVRILKEPLLHFLVAGGLLFAGYSWIHAGEKQENPRRIEITSNQVQQIELDWRARWQRPPTQAELQAGIADTLRQEVLYREALELGLDKDDTIVKRRMAQKMDFLADEISALREPAPGEVEAWFEKNRAQYVPPPLATFHHLYFSFDKRGATAEADARKALTTLRSQDASGGDSFMFQPSYSEQAPDQVARVFGSKFAEQLYKLEPGGWRGPVESGFGWHLVWVDSLLPGEPPAFESVATQVKADWLEEQRTELKRSAYEALKARYEIVIVPPKPGDLDPKKLAILAPTGTE
jgi:peptidyl-prolyl cis-trans isomerase C